MTTRAHLAAVQGDREAYVELLLEADEAEPLRSYLHQGDLFEIRTERGRVGACLLIREGDTVEIKNIALDREHRRRGLGRAAIDAIAAHAAAAGARSLLVGTSETSKGTIAFYRAVGFTDAGRRPGFFDAYPEPVVEDGRVAHDMVLFEMNLVQAAIP